MTSLASEDFALLSSVGANILRINVPWEAVEPEQGVFNETWLDELEALVNEAGRHGLYALLDMHQDAMSRYFCGTGMPAWVVLPAGAQDSFPAPLAATFPNISGRVPARPECDSINRNHWIFYYVTFSESAAFGQLYGNATVRAAFARFWAHVAQRFADNPAVIGYELMNEPFAGDVWKNPLLFLPPLADRENLQPLYDEVAAAIRAVVRAERKRGTRRLCERDARPMREHPSLAWATRSVHKPAHVRQCVARSVKLPVTCHVRTAHSLSLSFFTHTSTLTLSPFSLARGRVGPASSHLLRVRDVGDPRPGRGSGLCARAGRRAVGQPLHSLLPQLCRRRAGTRFARRPRRVGASSEAFARAARCVCRSLTRSTTTSAWARRAALAAPLW
jgi:hypothetical protein